MQIQALGKCVFQLGSPCGSLLLVSSCPWVSSRLMWGRLTWGIDTLLKRRYFDGSWVYCSLFAFRQFFSMCSAISSLMRSIGFPVSAINSTHYYSIWSSSKFRCWVKHLVLEGFSCGILLVWCGSLDSNALWSPVCCSCFQGLRTLASALLRCWVLLCVKTMKFTLW